MASDNVISFGFNGNAVRAVVLSELWWFLADICQVLGIANASNVAARLPDHCKNTLHSAEGTPGNPNATIINRAGLFRLLKESRKPVARELFDWVTDEVLPTLDRSGSYIASKSGLDILANVKQMVEPMRADLAELRYDMHRIAGRKGGEFSEVTKRLVCEVIAANGGKCANCGKVDVVDPKGNKLPSAQHDHFNGPSDASAENCFLVDTECHRKLKKAAYRNTRRSRFDVYLQQLDEFRRDGRNLRWGPPPEDIDPPPNPPKPKPASTPQDQLSFFGI